MSNTPAWVRAVRQDPRWVLLPLRAYLGITFLYAGLSKIGGRDFLDGSSPTSMHATLLAVKSQSPIGGLLGPVENHSFAFGLLIALGETAVGIGVLLGLFTRLAALGGVLISLSLFLTVSWNATPWYTGADIVYLFALTPLLLGGAGPLAADEWLAAARSRDGRTAAPAADRTRRAALGGIAGAAGLVAVGIAALARRSSPSSTAEAGEPVGAAAGTTAAAAPTSSGPPPGASSGPPSSASSTARQPAVEGEVVLAAATVPVGGAAATKDPKTGDPIYVLQLRAGEYTALDRICPHQGCSVNFVSRSAGFSCPCHQSAFDTSGNVTQGPATTGLKRIPVAEQDGQIVRR